MLVTEENFEFALFNLERADEVGVDTETTGLNVRNKVDYLMGVPLSVDGFDCYMPFRHPSGNLPRRYLDKLVDSVLNVKNLIWHNRKFDMHSFATIGVDPLKFKGIQYDTMLMAHLYNEELFSFELDFLASRFLKDTKLSKDKIHEFGKTFGYENVPVHLMSDYGCKDAQLTRRLKEHLWPLLIAEELDKVYLETEMPFTRILFTLEQRGVGVNSDFAEDKARIGRGRMATIQRELGYNPASPLDLAQYLLRDLDLPILAHTSSCQMCKDGFGVDTHPGKASFNKLVMEEYDGILETAYSNNPTARLISEYRGWQKAVTSLYEPLLEKVGPDGIIRTEFKQHGTVTGRLSANNPNLQQIPRNSSKVWNGKAKSSFKSTKSDFALVGWDYSQLELRLAAAYGREQILLTEFEKPDADPFAVLAPIIFGVFTPETRQDTKTFVYANLYGAGPAKIARQLGRSLDDTMPLYYRYKQGISGITDVSGKVSNLVSQRGFVKYWDGRRRHFRNRSDSYKAWNSVCQGGGAQLVKKAMIRCAEIEDDNCQMVLQVHDEITFDIDRGYIEKYEPLIKEAMTQWPGTPLTAVKFFVEGKEWK